MGVRRDSAPAFAWYRAWYRVTERARRYPWQPLERLLLSRLDPDAAGAKHLAELVDSSQRQVVRWRSDGMTLAAAERAAEKAGFVPYEVWPELLDDAIADLQRECEAVDCPVVFVVDRAGKRFCSRRCVMRAANARYYARHRDEVRARGRANAARYYAENGEYVRARQRRYDTARRAAAHGASTDEQEEAA